MNCFRYRTLLAMLLIFALSSGHSMGNDEKDYDERDDYIHDRAREAVNRGEIIALDKLLVTLQRQLPGDVIGFELENEHGNWIYEFKLIDQQGYLLEVEVDAKSGKILSIEED